MLLFKEFIMKVKKSDIIQLGNAIVAQIILVERSTLIVISKIVLAVQVTSTILMHKVS